MRSDDGSMGLCIYLLWANMRHGTVGVPSWCRIKDLLQTVLTSIN